MIDDAIRALARGEAILLYDFDGETGKALCKKDADDYAAASDLACVEGREVEALFNI
ncbi:Uncharacterised protein [uncultured archaeon]|nr:Uncharacterised protein [uncultured archaeon]